MLITGGERKACALVAMALTDLGIESESFTGSQAGFLTDTTHRDAKILEVNPYRIRDAVDAGKVPVVGGSQGVSTDNDVTFFGRGGSDTTAVALAARARGRRLRALHRRPRRLHRRPARSSPDAQHNPRHRLSFDETARARPPPAAQVKPALRSVELARSSPTFDIRVRRPRSAGSPRHQGIRGGFRRGELRDQGPRPWPTTRTEAKVTVVGRARSSPVHRTARSFRSPSSDAGPQRRHDRAERFG